MKKKTEEEIIINTESFRNRTDNIHVHDLDIKAHHNNVENANYPFAYIFVCTSSYANRLYGKIDFSGLLAIKLLLLFVAFLIAETR